jgi:hypothetical protein
VEVEVDRRERGAVVEQPQLALQGLDLELRRVELILHADRLLDRRGIRLEAEEHVAPRSRDPQPRVEVHVVRRDVPAVDGLDLDGPELAEGAERLVEVLRGDPQREAPRTTSAPRVGDEASVLLGDVNGLPEPLVERVTRDHHRDRGGPDHAGDHR